MDQTQGLGRDVLSSPSPSYSWKSGVEKVGSATLFPSFNPRVPRECFPMAMHAISSSGVRFTSTHSSSWTLPKRQAFISPLEAFYGSQCEQTFIVKHLCSLWSQWL